MTVRGLGIDIVSVERITKAMQRPGFLDRILAPSEREQTLSPQRVAGRWAVKEAVAKALGTRPGWQDVIVLNDLSGAPEVHVAPHRLPPGCRVLVSISHERDNAVAVAQVVGPP
jgi:phosphopantetheine--protein transferase-like protein